MRIFSGIVLVAALAGMVACHSTKGDQDGVAVVTGSAASDTGKVAVEVFAMSECPYWIGAAGVVIPLVRDFADFVDFRLYFIGEEAQGGVPASMHGDTEVLGDLYQVCTMKHAPKKLLGLIECQYGSPESFPDNFDACAKEIGLKTDRIKACVEGSEGRILLMESFKVSDEREMTASPTITIAGSEFDGPRTSDGLARALCEALGERKPDKCSQLPAPVRVDLTVVTDKRCDTCSQLVEIAPPQFKQVFPGLEYKVLDYSDEAAKELVKPLKGTEFRMLPVFIFDKNIKDDPSYEQFAPYLMEIGGLLVLATESSFDPDAEICDNGVDDDGNTMTDCADSACAQKLICRDEIRGRLDLFAMSQCPYGAMAFLSMPEVLKAFGKDVDFSVHFLVTETFPGQFQSLHGPFEVAEDFRQACAQKYYKKDNKFMDYFVCRAQDYESTDWQKCAVNGIDPAVLKSCSEGDEGRALLSADAKLSEALGINASPTWVANNRNEFSGISPVEVQAGFCGSNQGLKGCETPLTTGDSDVPAGACGQ